MHKTQCFVYAVVYFKNVQPCNEIIIFCQALQEWTWGRAGNLPAQVSKTRSVQNSEELSTADRWKNEKPTCDVVQDWFLAKIPLFETCNV